MPCDVRGFGMSDKEELESLLQLYKDGVKFITDEQLIMFMLDNNVGVHIETDTVQSAIKKLCYLCKLLSPEQMKKVRETGGLSTYFNLHDWYYTHLCRDLYHNDEILEKDIAISEMKRIDKNFTTSCSKCGIEIDRRNGDFSRNHREGCIYKL